MPSTPRHAAFPWPAAVRRWLWSFLGSALVALIVAAVPAVGARIGLAFAQDAIDGWPTLWVPLGVALLGGAFGAMAWGILVVNRGRDGRSRRYLLPSRAAVIETRSGALYLVFVAAAVGFAVVLGGLGVALALQALMGA